MKTKNSVKHTDSLNTHTHTHTRITKKGGYNVVSLKGGVML